MKGTKKKRGCRECARRKRLAIANEKARRALTLSSAEEDDDAPTPMDTIRLDWLGKRSNFTWSDGPGNIRKAIDSAMNRSRAFS